MNGCITTLSFHNLLVLVYLALSNYWVRFVWPLSDYIDFPQDNLFPIWTFSCWANSVPTAALIESIHLDAAHPFSFLLTYLLLDITEINRLILQD